MRKYEIIGILGSLSVFIVIILVMGTTRCKSTPELDVEAFQQAKLLVSSQNYDGALVQLVPILNSPTIGDSAKWFYDSIYRIKRLENLRLSNMPIGTKSSVPNSTSNKFANPSDIQEAKKFLREIPSACSGNYSVKADGTIVIRVKCTGNNQSMDGIIEIKDGVVKNIE